MATEPDLGPDSREPKLFSARLKPHRALSHNGFLILIGLVGVIAVLSQKRLAEDHALTEAANVSRQFAQTIAFNPSTCRRSGCACASGPRSRS